MRLVKIVIMLKKRFAEFYDIKQYKKHASEQIVVRQYTLSSKKITIDEEK